MSTTESPYRAAFTIVQRLRENGHEAYFVGGSVRDHLLGCPLEELGEIDVATSALPEQVEGLFARTIGVGKSFGVILVRTRGQEVEVATFRTESDYADGRRPSRVEYATAEEDVRRRDFTVNGLLLDPLNMQVRDFVGGVADLRSGVIRCIGDPSERFREDGLRLLRAVRFGSLGEFVLHADTAAALRNHRDRLQAIAKERVREELVKIASHRRSRRGDAWRTLVESGLATLVHSQWIPESADWGATAVDRLELRTFVGFLAATFGRVQNGASTLRSERKRAQAIAEDLRLSIEEARSLTDLLVDRGRYRGWSRLSAARQRLLATRIDAALQEDLLRAESGGQIVVELENDRGRWGRERPAPLVDGRALQGLGLRPGPGLGRLLRRARLLQLSHPEASAEVILTAVKAGGSRRALAQARG